MDELRNHLKTMNRQFGFYMKHKTAMKNNLIGISFIGFGFFFLSENHLTLPLFAPILRVISYNEPKGGMGSADL